jgi:5-methylcytosine-specific restriction endonuclease McrA
VTKEQEYQREYFEKNKERLKAYRKEWHQRNRERALAKQAERRGKDPERTKEERRLSYAKNREETRKRRAKAYAEDEELRERARARSRAAYAKNPERNRAWARRWNKEHPEEARERVAEWAKANPDKMQVIRLRRRGLLRKAGDANPAHLAKLLSEPCCAYCEAAFEPCSMRERTIDHVRPLVRGGTNATENLLAACRRCNSQKNRKTLEEWAATGRAPKGATKRLARVDT